MDRRLAPVAMLAALVGCTNGERHYPSLAPRPAEKQGFEEPAVPAPVVAPDAALDARLAHWSGELDRIVAGFTAAAAKADKAVAAAARQPPGSEPWLTAQGELATLDGWRGQASALTAEIEAAGSSRAGKLLPPYPTLDALGARAGAEVDRDSAEVARLQAMLPAA